MFRVRRACLVLLLLTPTLARAQRQATQKTMQSAQRARNTTADSAAAVAVVAQMHELMQRADSASLLRLLTDDVVVLESGGYESRAEFRSHHLPADIEYARTVKSERQLRSVAVSGDAAWVSSTSTTSGEFRGRVINSTGAELMVLRRTPDGWRIAAIHWLSRACRVP